jgi:biotin carboxylase
MPRILLLMTTHTYRAAAFLEAARRLGVAAVVGSERPQALAAVNPAGHLTLDFLEPERATRAIVDFARTYPLDAVVAADDDGVVLAAMAAAALGLPHHPVAAVEAARNKYRMRQLLAAAGIPCPRFWRFAVDGDPAEMARQVSYPCVLKPLALSASRGVIRADDAAQFVAAFHRLVAILQRPDVAISARRSTREILVERFIPGAEVAVEGLLTHGRLRVLAIFDKPDPLEGPFFEETLYVTPSRLPAAAQDAIVARTADVVEALGLRHGPIHAELRLNDQGAWILEIAPRSIGGLCSQALRFGDGMALEELLLRHALGEDAESYEREALAAGVMMIPIPQAGVLRQVSGVEEARRVPGIDDVRLTIPVGHAVVPVPEGSKYLGFIFARGATPEAVEAALRQAHECLHIAIAPVDEAAPPGGRAPGGERSADALHVLQPRSVAP